MRWLLTMFISLSAVAWIVSLLVFGTDQIRAAVEFIDWRPIAVGFIVVGLELGGAILSVRQIRRSRNAIGRIWTLVAVVAALVFALLNVYAGVVNSVG